MDEVRTGKFTRFSLAFEDESTLFSRGAFVVKNARWLASKNFLLLSVFLTLRFRDLFLLPQDPVATFQLVHILHHVGNALWQMFPAGLLCTMVAGGLIPESHHSRIEL